MSDTWPKPTTLSDEDAVLMSLIDGIAPKPNSQRGEMRRIIRDLDAKLFALTERLRVAEAGPCARCEGCVCGHLTSDADEIDRLRAENAEHERCRRDMTARTLQLEAENRELRERLHEAFDRYYGNDGDMDDGRQLARDVHAILYPSASDTAPKEATDAE